VIRHTASAIAIASLTLFTLVGCNDGARPGIAPGDRAPVSVDDLPDWVKDPTNGGKVVGAAGSSGPMKAGFNMARDTAMSRGRTELARSLEAKIQAAFKDWTREGGELTTEADKTMAMTVQENTAKTVVNQVLTGSTQKDLYQDKASGELFVWVVLDASAASEIAKKVVRTARKGLEEKKAHFAAKIEADKAFNDLEKQVNEELGLSGDTIKQ
jgi:hypothetical protein